MQQACSQKSATSSSGVTGEGAWGQSAPPETSDWEISGDLPGKKEARKKKKGKG